MSTHHTPAEHHAHAPHHEQAHHDVAAPHTEHHEHAPHHANAHHEAAARAPVDAPEADAAEHSERPAPQKPEGLAPHAEATVLPPETPVMKPPIQSVLPAAANDTDARESGTLQPVSEELRLKAEGNLAKFISSHMVGDHPKIAAEFAKGLKLNLKENINGPHDGLELCFQGELLTAGSGLFGEQVIAVLKEHPSFAALFHDDKTRPHFMKPPEAGKEDMLHVHVNHLSAAQFIALVNSIADSVPMPKPVHEKIMEQAKGTAIAPAPHASEKPSHIVSGPVADLEKGVANDNEIAPQGVAR